MLLISVLTVPITKALVLGQVGDVKFGVFGYCQGDKCSPVGIGYDAGKIALYMRPVITFANPFL